MSAFKQLLVNVCLEIARQFITGNNVCVRHLEHVMSITISSLEDIKCISI